MIVRLGIESGLQLQSAEEGPGPEKKNPRQGEPGAKNALLAQGPAQGGIAGDGSAPSAALCIYAVRKFLPQFVSRCKYVRAL